VHLGAMQNMQSEKLGEKGKWSQICLVQNIPHCACRYDKSIAFAIGALNS
jgi:hypothetical protein